MKIVVAVDSFKGSLTSNEAGKAIEEGIKRVFPDSNIVIKSMSDGGEGLIETLVSQMNGKIRTIKALDPLGKVIECSYGLIASRKLAVIEMAKVAGLTLVELKDRNPLNTTTYGLGQMILDAAKQGDSVGGILESCIYNLPCGIGEPFFDSLESHLSHLLFSIPAIKGVSFGLGFDFAKHYGSEVNDALYFDTKVKTKTNNNGGINGGISNGMPILIHTVVKPTPSIYKQQDTIDAKTKEAVKLVIEGRHDPAIIHRARVVVDSVLALGVLDLLLEKEAASHL